MMVFWFVVASLFVNLFNRNSTKELSYTAFKKHVADQRVAEITIQGDKITGRFVEPQELESNGRRSTYSSFSTTKPSFEDPELSGLLESNQVTVYAESEDPSWLGLLAINLLPWVLLIGFLYYSSRKAQERLGGNLLGIGRSRARLYTEAFPTVTFDDVAGLENAKTDLKEVIDYLKEPRRFASLGAKLPKGILLMGAPGTGKTLLARACAGEAQVPFFSISGSEFIEMFVGVGASRVRDMFDNARARSPSIIFIDEIDSIGRARGTGLGGGHDEREQTLNQILAEMDGFAPHESVVVMAATNRPDVLDAALTRPGRFDRQVVLELPQKNARKRILEIHTRHLPLAGDVDLVTIATETVGFSGADLENLANEAALLAGRKSKRRVELDDFLEARDKVTLGNTREEPVSNQDKRVTAHHEAGHALVAKLLPNSDPVKSVSIVPRGQSLGATQQFPSEDRHHLSRSYLFDRIAILLGGRVAEKIALGDITSGASEDLKQATRLAQRMVCQWGMSDRLGPVAFRHGEEHLFLGKEMAEKKDFSEHAARLIDQEIQKIVRDMEERVWKLLTQHRDKLKELAGALLEQETLEEAEIDAIVQKETKEHRIAASR